MRPHLTNMRLFGAGTRAGAVLGDEPNGIGIDHSQDQICIRDATGAKNYLGRYSELAPSDRLSTSALPFTNYQPVSGVFTGIASGSYPSYQVYMNWANAGNTIFLRLHDNGGRQGALQHSNAEFNFATANNWADSTPFKIGFRSNTDDAYVIVNGNSGSANTDATCPTNGALQANLDIWVYPPNAAIQFNGTRGTVLLVPRALSNAELTSRTTF